MNLSQFKESLQNLETIGFTNGLFYFELNYNLDTTSKADEIELNVYFDSTKEHYDSSLTWEINTKTIKLVYDMFIELVKGYNSSLDSRGYDHWIKLSNALEIPIVA